MGLINRWVVGDGGLISEASLVEASEADRRVFRHRCRPICELTDVYTHPACRGRGWASVAVDAALEYADAEKLDVILRVVAFNKSFPAAVRHRLDTPALTAFYGRRGFVQRRIDPRLMIRRHRAR